MNGQEHRAEVMDTVVSIKKLGDYEHDRFRSHKHILKIVTYGALAILLILMAMTNIPFFPNFNKIQ